MARAYLVLLAGILAVSFASIFIRLADAPALVIAAYRLSLASLILAPVAMWRSRDELARLNRRDLRWALLAGVFLALHFATWITSLQFTTVASSVVIVTSNPIFVGLAAHFLTHEQVTRQMWVGIALAVVGGALVGFGDIELGSRALFGDALALVGAIGGASYFLIGRQLRDKVSLLAYVSIVYSTAAGLLVLMAALAGHSFVGYSPQTYLLFLLLALGPQIIGHSSFNWALKYLSATFVTVAILGEPIGSTILAALLLAETPGPLVLVGGAMILVGIALASRAEGATRVAERVPRIALQR